MNRSGVRLIFLILVLISLSPALAGAQSSARSSLAGVVVDGNGGVVPGATVVITKNDTGVTVQLVTNGSGAFSAPALDAGTYTVTVTLSGFKTAIVKDVKLVAGTPANLPNILLSLGNLEETVEVRAGTELVQTQTASVSSTLNVTQITRLPVVSQNGSTSAPAITIS